MRLGPMARSADSPVPARGPTGLAAATHGPFVMHHDLLARRARSTASAITSRTAATAAAGGGEPREKRGGPRGLGSSAPMGSRAWVGVGAPGGPAGAGEQAKPLPSVR